jgi:hypothetical protein
LGRRDPRAPRRWCHRHLLAIHLGREVAQANDSEVFP